MATPTEEFEKRLQQFAGLEIGAPEVGPDLVNEPMIRHWCQVLGDLNPVYTDPDAAKNSLHGGIVAPPTMLQTWILDGFDMATPEKQAMNKQRELHAIFNEQGYTGVVATNCDQGYDRYLKPGDKVTGTTVIESISEEKATAIGIGYFIETRTTFRDQNDEQLGWMVFRVLKFKPSQQPATVKTDDDGAATAPVRLRAPRTHDNGWWWDKIDEGELHIQKCGECGVLRHPPRPMCGECRSADWTSVVSTGKGVINSYVIMHHPPIPGYGFPIACAVIDLEEGTRIISNIVGCELDEVHIDMKVALSIENVDAEMKLPLFKPAQ